MKYYLFSITLMCSGVIFSQNTLKSPPQSRQTRTVAPVAPELTKEMEQYAAVNGSYITDIPNSDQKEIQFDGEISMEVAQLVDPNKMGLAITNRGQVYKISGTNKLLFIKSTWVLDSEMNNQIK